MDSQMTILRAFVKQIPIFGSLYQATWRESLGKKGTASLHACQANHGT